MYAKWTDHTRWLHFWTNAKSAWKVTNQWVNSLLNQRMQLTEQRESGLGFCKLGSMTKLQMTQTRGCSSAVSALPWYSMKAATNGFSSRSSWRGDVILQLFRVKACAKHVLLLSLVVCAACIKITARFKFNAHLLIKKAEVCWWCENTHRESININGTVYPPLSRPH